MINNLVREARKFLESREYDLAMEKIIADFGLTEDEGGVLAGKTNMVILGEIEEEDFISVLMDYLEIDERKAQSIKEKVYKDLITPFSKKLMSQIAANTGDQSASADPSIAAPAAPSSVVLPEHAEAVPANSITTFRQAPSSLSEIESQSQKLAPVAPIPRKEESLSKADILDQIENPPRTVIRKYVLEHEPITDPDHLIDDKIDNVPKLQDHYND